MSELTQLSFEADSKIIQMSNGVFEKLSGFIHSNLGIDIPLSKKLLLQTRLHKRLTALQFKTFDEYCDFLFSNQGQSTEVKYLVDLVSTHKTNFFREPHHFEFLTKNILPNFHHSPFSSWSAGCSTGEEAYTLAMVLKKYQLKNTLFMPPDIIYATDISNQCIQKAKKGIYPLEDINDIEDYYCKQFMSISKLESLKKIRIKPDIRSMVEFNVENLIQNSPEKINKYDLILCRNVIIYFEELGGNCE